MSERKKGGSDMDVGQSGVERKSAGRVHLWVCQHKLCERAVQDVDVDYLRFMGRHTKDEERIARAGTLLFDKLNTDAPPKCVGGPAGKATGGGYRSHRATPMRLVAFDPVETGVGDDA